MATMQLPAEIVCIVLEELRDDEEALRACAVVCTGWTPIVQKYLWRKLEITLHVRTKSHLPPFKPTVRIAPDIRPLYKAFKSSPHLPGNVKELSVKIHGDYWRYTSLSTIISNFIVSRISRIWHRYLPFILESLINVERFSFTNYLLHPLLTTCPDTVRDAFISVLRRPTLSTLSMPFGSALELFTMLCECPHLSSLSVGMITCRSHVDLSLYPRVPALTPNSLLVSCGKFWYLRLLNREFPSQSSIHFDNLHRIQIHVGMCYVVGDVSVVNTTEEVIRRNRATLRHLALNVCLNEPLTTLVDPTSLLSVDFQIHSTARSSQEHPAPRSWLDWLIASFPIPSTTDISIESCTLQLVQFCLFEDVRTFYDKWEALDGIFTSWPRLGKLSVQIQRQPYRAVFSPESDTRFPVTRVDVQDMFPRMMKEGRLVVVETQAGSF
ncbi:hypothetical protein ARMSODRAFT_966434 [Armillaria solidipes]|uniref:Uncharacterized protein n=1 Tax=Armillaria solidipes TaxID=1076256 RepID=A0A2H3AYY6_9AGAR|nr:hypothetical protein ARMSODRAFT_966434 [Armillaria solidipes]